MESGDTRLARAVWTQAALARADHLTHCPACQLAQRRRRPGERCAAGQDLALDERDAKHRLDAEKAADAAPNPNQAPLFDMPG